MHLGSQFAPHAQGRCSSKARVGAPQERPQGRSSSGARVGAPQERPQGRSSLGARVGAPQEQELGSAPARSGHLPPPSQLADLGFKSYNLGSKTPFLDHNSPGTHSKRPNEKKKGAYSLCAA